MTFSSHVWITMLFTKLTATSFPTWREHKSLVAQIGPWILTIGNHTPVPIIDRILPLMWILIVWSVVLHRCLWSWHLFVVGRWNPSFTN